jgi:hypothetical protein
MPMGILCFSYSLDMGREWLDQVVVSNAGGQVAADAAEKNTRATRR